MSSKLFDFIRVGTVQTVLDLENAWKSGPSMSESEQENARIQISKALTSFNELDKLKKPQIILLPELSIPNGFQRDLQRMADVMESVIIGGLDYQKVRGQKLVSNKAVVIIPSNRNSVRVNRSHGIRFVGKSFASEGEERNLAKVKYKFEPDPNFWIFEDEELGNFGVAICYDFLDLERAAMYKNKIQHLFILAYNKDITSFKCVAEAICRIAFCNVVVCNTGYYGGSLAVSPYYTPYKRTIYAHEGKDLATEQVINLPVAGLYDAQHGIKGVDEKGIPLFKSKPPGFKGNSTFDASKLKKEKL